MCWEAVLHVPQGSADGEWRIYAGQELVAVVNDAADAEARALLLAAAPKLLEALRKVTDHLAALTDNIDHPLAHTVCAIARAAIAKAEGRE